MSRLLPNTINALVAAWRAAGLAPEPIESIAGTAAAAFERLGAERRAFDDHAGQRRRLVDELATGDIDLRRAVLAWPGSQPDTRQTIATIQRAAVDRVCANAFAQLRAIGDGLITDHLAPAHADVVAVVVKYAPTIEGIETDADAIAVGGKVRDAWGQIANAFTRSGELHKVATALRRGSIVTPLAPTVDATYLNWARPDLTPDLRHQLRQLHPLRRFVTFVECGRAPGIYTAEQAASFAAAERAPRGSMTITLVRADFVEAPPWGPPPSRHRSSPVGIPAASRRAHGVVFPGQLR